MSIIAVVSLIIQLLPGILQMAGVVTPATAGLITQLSASLPSLIAGIATGVPEQPMAEVASILEAFQPELAILQQNGKIDRRASIQAGMLMLAIENSLARYREATTNTDPSTLTPLPEVL